MKMSLKLRQKELFVFLGQFHPKKINIIHFFLITNGANVHEKSPNIVYIIDVLSIDNIFNF